MSAATTQCLKKHGITLPTGGSGANPPVMGQPGAMPSMPAGISPAKLQAAFAACGVNFPAGGGAGPGAGAGGTAFQAFQSCMKDHGVTTAAGMPNPGAINQKDPKVAAAFKTCGALLPANGPGQP